MQQATQLRPTAAQRSPGARAASFRPASTTSRRSLRVRAAGTGEEEVSIKETTEKFGLEAGLFKVFTAKRGEGVSKGQQAKDLLAQYGSAYLITSISFALVSFAACYALVNSGVDVAALLSRVGLTVNDTSEKVGTFAIAYAAHKALSPVRFPPTVALTPVVATWLGKKKEGGGEGGEGGGSSSA